MISIGFLDTPHGGALAPGDIRAIFGFEAYLQHCVDVEVALG